MCLYEIIDSIKEPLKSKVRHQQKSFIIIIIINKHNYDIKWGYKSIGGQ